MAGGKSGEVDEEERIKGGGRKRYLFFFKKWVKIIKKKFKILAEKGQIVKN